MKLYDPDLTSDLQYYLYKLSKSHLHINRALRKVPDQALDEISIDVVSPITPIGFNGHRYATLITDRKSRARWGSTHKTKNEAHRVLKDFIMFIWT